MTVATPAPQTYIILWRVNVPASSFSVTINKGDTIHWIWNDNFMHNVASGLPGAFDGLFRSGNPVVGSTFSQTFWFAGSFSYHCEIHTSLVGVINVVYPDTSSNTATSTTPFKATLAQGTSLTSTYSAASIGIPAGSFVNLIFFVFNIVNQNRLILC
jgi:hypothetical protein